MTTNSNSNEETVVVKEKKAKRYFSLKRDHLCIPYSMFLIIFVVFPLLIIVYYAFTSPEGHFTFDNFAWFFSEPAYIMNLLRSILIGLGTTAICLVIGYAIAYVLSRIKSHRRTILLLLFIMPMWINFVLRAMAMKELLSFLGIYGKHDWLSLFIGMVYDYLPFMILPLYTTLTKMDSSLEEAAADLGGNSFTVFFKVTLPLSIPGIISGATMVFLPSMTSYVISDTFGNKNISIIGKLIETWFGMDDYNYGSVIALILLVVMFLTTLFTGGFSKEENNRGTAL